MRRYIGKPAIVRRMQSACLRKAKAFLLNYNIMQYIDAYTDVKAYTKAAG
jgi:hypothetical protein